MLVHAFALKQAMLEINTASLKAIKTFPAFLLTRNLLNRTVNVHQQPHNHVSSCVYRSVPSEPHGYLEITRLNSGVGTYKAMPSARVTHIYMQTVGSSKMVVECLRCTAHTGQIYQQCTREHREALQILSGLISRLYPTEYKKGGNGLNTQLYGRERHLVGRFNTATHACIHNRPWTQTVISWLVEQLWQCPSGITMM